MIEHLITQHRGLSPFEISAKYIDIDRFSAENTNDSHIHKECEIYINLSGDVSFMVENRIYPVLPGSIIITRPYEYHHCVYHSNKRHKHFWILFSCDGNEEILDIFFNRNPGEKNLLILPENETEQLIQLCHQLSGTPSHSEAEKYYRFFSLLKLLESADRPKITPGSYPKDISFALKYISENISRAISVRQLADSAHVSINTLERHFAETLNITPREYIRKKRLANAAKLLYEGCGVTEACEKSGFPDYSGFISLFKKTYGITPLKYKKNLSGK